MNAHDMPGEDRPVVEPTMPDEPSMADQMRALIVQYGEGGLLNEANAAALERGTP